MKVDKQIQGHREGMAYALKIVKEKGIEGLEKEIKFRGLMNVPITVPKKTVDDFVEEIKTTTLETVLIMTIAVLHDEFGFGQKRCQQMVDRFNSKAECLADDYCTWQDYIDVIQDEIGIELNITGNRVKKN